MEQLLRGQAAVRGGQFQLLIDELVVEACQRGMVGRSSALSPTSMVLAHEISICIGLRVLFFKDTTFPPKNRPITIFYGKGHKKGGHREKANTHKPSSRYPHKKTRHFAS